ncbi:hypothetical protein [Marinoscillum furvescens]|uniref:Uncharacterized protein n=1 Tax=Marinoscillum furvescens DSM 4134 TaxID=1122208 RepID=A0A3D9KW09_MARFU|nr:hypothetical protein [Marinoscillum furvescens]RED91909.1 hypothetical protein C7460_13526 [Marinoscillum furvescens DSM 4134]
METLAIIYIIMGLFFMSAFALKKVKTLKGKQAPTRLGTTLIPHVKIKTIFNKQLLKEVFES